VFVLLAALSLPSFAGDLPSVDEALKTGASAPADAAVVVGIEDYAFVADVPFAARDAQAMYRFLVYTRGVPSDRVHLLDEGVNREALWKALENARAEVEPGGTLWVYFAGHGAASPTTGERLLLGDDVRGNADTLEARGVELSKVLDLVEGTEHEALVLVDACCSGVGRDGEALVEGTGSTSRCRRRRTDTRRRQRGIQGARASSPPQGPMQAGEPFSEHRGVRQGLPVRPVNARRCDNHARGRQLAPSRRRRRQTLARGR